MDIFGDSFTQCTTGYCMYVFLICTNNIAVCVCMCVYLEKEMATHFNTSCLENPTDRGARHATAHGVEKSGT